MQLLQNRTESDSDCDIDSSDTEVKKSSGWNDETEFDRYVANKSDDDGKIKSLLCRKANVLASLYYVIFQYNISFEKMNTPSGWTHKARCPFPDHNDGSPSFWYNSKEYRFKCFGCDRAGGTVQFLAAMQQRPQFEIAKELLSKKSSPEVILADLEDKDDIKIDQLILDFSKEINIFLQSHAENDSAIEFVEKLTWNLDMYLEKNAFAGLVNFESLQMRIEKLRERLNLFGG